MTYPTPQPSARAIRSPSATRHLGRGARSNASSRYDTQQREPLDAADLEDLAAIDGSSNVPTPVRNSVSCETARSIIARNDSPDIGFDRSINPYRGCEHGCSYCYARPTHAYLGHSAGLDFETKIYAKTNAAQLLMTELSAPNYKAQSIAIGTVTDPYQPIEREYKITRQLLEILEACQHPVGLVTKSFLVTRDIDILGRLAKHDLVKVALSVTTLDPKLARSMEPRAATPQRRLDAIRQLSEAGVPTTVLVAPIIPGLNDSEIEAILVAAKEAGARSAGFVTLRLPLELKDLFQEWLASDQAGRAKRVMKLVRSLHGGKDYSSAFGLRQTGRGPYAEHIGARFRLAVARLGLNAHRFTPRTDLFKPPKRPGAQFELAV